MGVSLLLTYLQLPDTGDPDYAAGHAAAENLTLEQIETDGNLGQAVQSELEKTARPEGASDNWPTEQDFLAALKRRLQRRVDELRAAHGDAETRRLEQPSHEHVVVELFGHRVLLTGGPSQGDAPTDLYETIVELCACPAVLRAMRCDLVLRSSTTVCNRGMLGVTSDAWHEGRPPCPSCCTPAHPKTPTRSARSASSPPAATPPGTGSSVPA